MRILIDFDNVLNDLDRCWVRELNRRYHCGVDEIKEYDMCKLYPTLTEKQIYLPYFDGTLYMDISPCRQAQLAIRELIQKHEIYIVTANLFGFPNGLFLEYLRDGFNPRAMEYMMQFLVEYYPEIPQKNIIITSQKRMVYGDVLVDDNPANFNGVSCRKILLDKPYNRGFDEKQRDIFRAEKWRDIVSYIEEMV